MYIARRKIVQYYHEGSGIIRIVGCAGLDLKKNFYVLFSEGHRAWIRRKAHLGSMESVVIKRVNAIFPKNRPSEWGVQPEVTYTDTFNRVSIEEELLTEENAIDIARIYWENVAQHARRVLQEDGCLPITPEGCS